MTMPALRVIIVFTTVVCVAVALTLAGSCVAFAGICRVQQTLLQLLDLQFKSRTRTVALRLPAEASNHMSLSCTILCPHTLNFASFSTCCATCSMAFSIACLELVSC